MKTVIKVTAIVLGLVAIASPAFASTSLKFVAANNSAETQVCLTAAQQGMQAAQTIAIELGLSKSESQMLICNGREITSFSRKYQKLNRIQQEQDVDSDS